MLQKSRSNLTITDCRAVETYMDPIELSIVEPKGISRRQEPFELGVPLGKGVLTDSTLDNLSLASHCREIPFQHAPIAYWPDGSIRWLKLTFITDIAANESLKLRLRQQESETIQKAKGLKVEDSGGGWLIETATGCFQISKKELAWHYNPSCERNDGSPIQHLIRLTNSQSLECTPETETGWRITEQGPLKATLSTEGFWMCQGEKLARFYCDLTFYHDSPLADLKVGIHNPRRARHPGGLWDLGDEGSITFGSLWLEILDAEAEKNQLIVEPGREPIKPGSEECALLYQDSSGGKNWDSLNHVDASGTVSTQFCGYRVTLNDRTEARGKRACPLAMLKGENRSVQAAMPDFWQNFPSALAVENTRIKLSLFPEEGFHRHELQGGERKTQTLKLRYDDDVETFTGTFSPIRPVLSAAHYERSSAFHWFKAHSSRDGLDDLIKEGLDGNRNFFAKREIIDEYGWRSFGDIFADHETLYQPESEPPLISHYNNQYDPIYGFARQYAKSGDPRWFELMDDLARHVTDIDIYHTNDDRAEYNQGLFWHTDHYLPAHTATHRTFSKHNDTSSTPGQTGGGPAPEHCYTTGLLYHFLMTGNPASRSAVLDLANWMIKCHEGTGALLEQLLAIKKQELPKLRALIKHERPNRHRYPFTRGTGNYLNTLLDAYVLEPKQDWMPRAETVIAATFHPADLIEQRNLLDVENGWHYLVLLASLSRYLLIKNEYESFDDPYQYALACFRHYMRWMLANERPFLTNPGQLEFANHTWVAQDIRKSMLMYQASSFDPPFRQSYLERAHAFANYVTVTLSDSSERNLSRVLIIVLQNYGPHQVQLNLKDIALETSNINQLLKKPPILSPRTLAFRIARRLIGAIRNFRPSRERAWLNARVGR